ncbi:MAG TPA: methyl-accepting chemotaxis protein, partial [Sulfuricurvum sp.]|nr:methyl-accepting chemotaxis protein [Sulfuricurvum sp.]
MINNMAIKSKLLLLLGIVLSGLIIMGIVGSSTISSIKDGGTYLYEKRTVALGTMGRIAMHFDNMRAASFRTQMFNDPSKWNENKAILEKESEELFKLIPDYEKTYATSEDKQQFEDLIEQIKLYTQAYDNIYKAKISANELAAVEAIKTMAPISNATSEKIGDIIKMNLEAAKKVAENNNDTASNGLALLIIIGLIVVIFSAMIGSMVMNNITKSVEDIKDGLISFFAFLGRETEKAKSINVNSDDEFGIMAKVINDNVIKIEKEMLFDREVISDITRAANEIKLGKFHIEVTKSTTNPNLEQLKKTFSEVVHYIDHNVARDLNLLLAQIAAYKENDFTHRIPNAYGRVAVALNELGDEISHMLKTALQNGMDLQGDAGNLKQAVESLSTASNQQAASLEETAAAMEEMTSNVQQNAQKANDMASMAAQTDASAKEGAELAQRTATAMTEIQVATNSI